MAKPPAKPTKARSYKRADRKAPANSPERKAYVRAVYAAVIEPEA